VVSTVAAIVTAIVLRTLSSHTMALII